VSTIGVNGAAAPARPPSALGNIAALARRELRDALRSRWFVLYGLAFAALGLGVSYVSGAAGGGGGSASGFGRTTAGLINIVLLVVPLMALSAGAGSIAGDRERGMLAYLCALPVSRVEVLLGKFVGLAVALAASVCLGLGLCAGVLAWRGSATSAASVAGLAGLSIALAWSMLGVGLLISALARRASVASGVAVFVWLSLVFVSDLGLMAGGLAMKLRVQTLLAAAVANPLQVFKLWALYGVEASLDVLGPAGAYADDTIGTRLPWVFGACLAAWIVIPVALAAAAVSRRSPV
jgi:Cu-processing system permease protein